MAKMTPQIVAICGLMRSGKDTVADYLIAKYGYSKIKIAGQLKEAVKAMFGFTDNQLENSEKDLIDTRWNITPRQAMQFLGTDVMQFQAEKLLPNIGRTFWISSMVMTMKSFPDKKYVVSDLRFIHELDYLKNAYPGNVFVIRVDRPQNESLSNHSSEVDFKNMIVDACLKNDGDLDHLYSQINQIAQFDGLASN